MSKYILKVFSQGKPLCMYEFSKREKAEDYAKNEIYSGFTYEITKKAVHVYAVMRFGKESEYRRDLIMLDNVYKNLKDANARVREINKLFYNEALEEDTGIVLGAALLMDGDYDTIVWIEKRDLD